MLRSSYGLIAVVLASLVLAPVHATGQDTATVKGTVVGPDTKPIEGANVFLLETLDGATTSADGKFAIKQSGAALTLVVRKLGFVPQSIKLTMPLTESVMVTLVRATPALSPITVLAGRYTANEERTATLTPLEVVTTPGTAADVNRAIQTLPGIQQVDEGTGLFVRGGDYNETRVFLNETGMLNPIDVQSPNGTFTGTVDPFLLDGIVFSSGGFGARFGNALSAAVDLHTMGLPKRRAASASLGLAGVSASIAEPLSPKSGVRFATNLLNLQPLLSLNGSSRDYDPAPRGRDISASFNQNLGKGGEFSVFAIDKTQRLGVGVDDPDYSGTYGLETSSRSAVGTWRAALGSFTHVVSASSATFGKNEEYGAFLLRTNLDQQQLFAQTSWSAPNETSLRLGAELERLDAAFDGSVPNTAIDVKPGSRIRKLGSDQAGFRLGFFTEADTRIGERLRLISGIRTDHSDLTHQRTFDPRISAALKTFGSATVTAAWGIYHEIPDPLLFEPTYGDPTLESMRAVHSILGFQAGDNVRMIRFELYDKQYSSLSRQTRDFSVGSDGEGYARGADLFLKGNGPFNTRSRLTYSYVHSRRTDANSSVMADAPFDVPHTITFITQKSIGTWEAGVAYRYSSGRPFTPVTGASFNSLEDRWIPIYGNPFSERLPLLTRVDLSLSHMQKITSDWRAVIYGSVNNAFARHNIYSFTYNADFTKRRGVPSLFDRSLYVGATILH